MSTQTTLNYRTNRDFFSNYHLDEHLPETEAWDQVDDDELQAAYDDIKQLWEREKDTAPKRNESQLEDSFIRPMFRKLGIPFEVEESTEGTQRRPDYGFFKTEEDGIDAFQRREEGGDFYKNAIAVADAKRWGRKLDTRGKKKRDYENPSHQIDQYLRFTSTTWGVLTNGQKWRLYYKPTSHRLDSYYEIDLPTVLEQGDLEDFKYFYLFFRRDAFVPDTSGDAFLDDVYEESNVFAQELGEDLQDNIYEAIKVLAEGYLQYPENDLDEENLELIHDSSLIYLYRIIFVLYAEAEGRDLLDTNNEIYESQYSLNQLKQEVADELESGDPKYRDWQSNLQSRLDELFMLIDQGSKSRGIPEEDLYIPAYNGGLFRTDPDESGSDEALFLANHTVGDEHLARVIELLTRSESSNGGGKIFVDYSSLDVRHLGSIYEGLLEYQLNVADKPLAINDGEYVGADESTEVVVERDDVYLTTGGGERKATGSYYTPEYVVEYIVEETLSGPVDDIRKDVVMDERFQDGGYAAEFAERVFDLKILDPAMGSGHFLTSVVDYLARAIITEQNREAENKDGGVIDDEHDINWARRKVAQHCIYGVDINPLATELAKVSLWLRTLAADQPLAFLDHHLKDGNSLVGSDITTVLSDESEDSSGQLTLSQSFARARQQTLGHVMDLMADLLAIDNEELKDIKSMEKLYEKIQDDPLYQRLFEVANVHTAEHFGIDVPTGVYEDMAMAIDDAETWAEIQEEDWFKSAQATATEQTFFHWELEYPEVFFGDDGSRLDDAGFDAVIGNPPYVSNWELTENHSISPRTYENMYPEAAVGHWDLYVIFCYKALSLTNVNGYHSFITPNSLTTEKYARALRNHFIENTHINKIVDFGETDVFSGVDRQCVIYIVSNTLDDRQTDIIYYSDMNYNKSFSIDQDVFKQYKNSAFRIALSPEDIELKRSIESKSISLGAICCVNPGVVSHSGSHSDLDFNKEDILHEHQQNEGFKQYLEGGDIQRYALEWQGKYIDYDSKRDHFHRPKYPELFENPKVIFRRISGANNRLISCFDYENYYTTQRAAHAVNWSEEMEDHRGPADYEAIENAKKYDIRYLTATVNSSLVGYYFSNFLATGSLQGSYTDVYPEDIRQLPIKTISKETLCDEIDTNYYIDEIPSNEKEQYHALITLSKNIKSMKDNLFNLNLNLLDHLGNYDDGPTLSDIGLSQPSSGSADSILQETATEKPNLRVGEASVIRESNTTVEIRLTARYKPSEDDDLNEADYETDQWGYTEADLQPALRITDLSETEADLIEAFVPIAIDEAGGFANFRETATKTNSLVDRLRKLTLPVLADVEAELDRYTQTKERADELNEKIEKNDQLIDEIVYDLYDLTDEEIDIVESAVADD